MSFRKNSLLLFLTVFIDMMGFSVIFPIFPETLKFFMNQGSDPTLHFFLNLAYLLQGSDSHTGYFIVILGGLTGSIYAVLQFLFAPFWGKLSDRFGRRPVLIFTSFGNFLGYILWLFSGSFSLFVLSRFITGSMGGNISVASAAMADITTGENRTKGMGIIGAGIGLGFILGPPLGGILASVDFPNTIAGIGLTVFPFSAFLSILIACVNLLLILFLFQETLDPVHQKASTGFQHPVLGIKDTNVKELPLLCLIYFLFTLGFSGFEFSLNFFFNDFLHFTPKQIGFSFVYMGFLVILVQGGIIRRISGKVPEKKIAFLGISFLIIGFVLLYFAHSGFYSFICLTFLSLGSAFFNPSISSLASLFSPSHSQGKNLGTLRGFGSLARALSPVLFSILYFRLGPHTSFLISGVFSLFVLFFVQKIPAKR